MAIGSGLAGQLGIKAETTYGTPVVVDRFYEFNSEQISDNVAFIDSAAIGMGAYLRSDRSKANAALPPTGTIEMPFHNKGMGIWLEHALGAVATTGAGADKTHTVTPNVDTWQGKSLTLQVGTPSTNEINNARTYEGVKIVGWELKCDVGGILTLTLTTHAERVRTPTYGTGAALATGYPTLQEMYVFTEGGVTIAAVSQFVRSFSLKGTIAADQERIGFGGSVLKPLPNGLSMIEGTLGTEFQNITQYENFLNGVQSQLIATFTLATLIPTTANPFKFTVTVPKIQFTGSTPNVSGPTVLQQDLPFRALYDGTNAVVTMAYVTNDAAP